jgi:hypothetical protein
MNRILKASLLASFPAVLAAGCNPASLSYFLFKGDGTAPATHALKAPENKKSITIAVLMAAPNAPMEFAGVERDITAELGRVFAANTAKMKAPIRIVDQAKIDRFKLDTPGWKTMSQTDVGRRLGADYVIEGTITGLGLYEPGMGVYMYQGRANVSAVVYDVAGNKQDCDYFLNPKMEARPADSVPPAQYRGLLVKRIAEEVSWQHLPHISDRRVNPVQ